MANPAPAPTPGGADPSVQSSISAGGKQAKADVAMASLATGSKTSEDSVSEPRSWSKVTPLKPHQGGRPRAKLSRRESWSPKRSVISVVKSRHDFRVASPAPCRLMRGSTERTAAAAMGVSRLWRRARSLRLAAARLAWVAKRSKPASLRRGTVGVDLVHPVMI